MYDAFIAAAEPLVKGYVLGDPLDAKTSLGCIAQPWHPKELQAFVDNAVSKGAKLVAGGKQAQVNGKGRFFEATLLAGVPQDADIMQKESFGPILAVSVVDDDMEALEKMNQSRLGLTASVWTKSEARAIGFAQALEFGTVYMNRCDALDPALPWTGWKDSGRGSTLSPLGFDGLTKPKSIHFRLSL